MRGGHFATVHYGRTKQLDDGSTLVFRSRETIVLIRENGQREVFHRWYTPRGFYTTNWRPFWEALSNAQHLTAHAVYELANRYEIQHIFSSFPQAKDSKKGVK